MEFGGRVTVCVRQRLDQSKEKLMTDLLSPFALLLSLYLLAASHLIGCQDPPREPPSSNFSRGGALVDNGLSGQSFGTTAGLAHSTRQEDATPSTSNMQDGENSFPYLSDMDVINPVAGQEISQEMMDMAQVPDAMPPAEDMSVPPPIALPDECEAPLELPLADCRPTPLPSTGDLIEDCVRRINQLRAVCQCLPPLERWYEGEECAREHANYDGMTGQAHNGFNEGICSQGGRGQNECPGYRSEEQVIGLCLQQMWDEGPGEPFSQHGHYLNMTNPSFSRVACGFFTTAGGQVWAVQNFSP